MSKRRIEIEGTTLGPNAAKLAKPVLTPGMKVGQYLITYMNIFILELYTNCIIIF